MLPKAHTILGFIFSILALLIFPKIGLLGFIIIWAASVLIDVDHYLYYVFVKKDLSLKRAYKWFKSMMDEMLKTPYKERIKIKDNMIFFLHGIESLVIFGLLSFTHKIFLYIWIGFLFHHFLDFINALYLNVRLKSHFGSLIWNILTRDK